MPSSKGSRDCAVSDMSGDVAQGGKGSSAQKTSMTSDANVADELYAGAEHG